MLRAQFGEGAVERTISCEPLVDDNAQRILVTSGPWLPLDLFGRHVSNSPNHVLSALVARTLGNQGNPEIAEQNLVAPPEQHILWFDITVHQSLFMSMLQGSGKIFDIRHDGAKRQACAFRVTLAQCAMRCIVHDKKWRVALDAEIHDPYNIGMYQACNQLSFAQEAIQIFLS